jgi:hypothetical protein
LPDNPLLDVVAPHPQVVRGGVATLEGDVGVGGAARLLADDTVVALLELDDLGLGVHPGHALEAAHDGLGVAGNPGDLQEEVVCAEQFFGCHWSLSLCG